MQDKSNQVAENGKRGRAVPSTQYPGSLSAILSSIALAKGEAGRRALAKADRVWIEAGTRSQNPGARRKSKARFYDSEFHFYFYYYF